MPTFAFKPYSIFIDYPLKYIPYYRVSTQKQGRSGLGLDDQRFIVRNFLKADDEVAEEFIEVESGRKNARPQFTKAIEAAKRHRARLLIAKLDRLSRNAAFVMALRDSEVDFIACDLPDANTLTVGIMATFAQHEAERTAERTRAALAQKKARGFTLGTPANLTEVARRKGTTAVQDNARLHLSNRQATELSLLYRKMGLTLWAIAARLNGGGYLTRRGCAFQARTVLRLLERITDSRLT